MSLWGLPKLALNAFLIINIFLYSIDGCLDNIFHTLVPLALENNYSLSTLAVINLSRALVKYDSKSDSKIIGQRFKACRTGHVLDNLTKKQRSTQRIGPHNFDILSIIFGSLLGDAHAEYRIQGKGTRICFYQEAKHSAYLMWLHNIISNLGYCNPIKPEILKRLGKKGVVRNVVRFKTWTYSSFNWIYELWYNNNIKVVPFNIGDYLTPLALAIWIMDDGSKSGSSLKLASNSFTFSECSQLVKVLYDKYNIKASVQSAGVENQYVIYIFKESMPILCDLVLPYVHPSMKYKLNY
jgi:ubiquinol-cytochrome c reductase cytochrome b subunit